MGNIKLLYSADLRDAVNELCEKCGNYRREHLGACNDCRWFALKKDFSSREIIRRRPGTNPATETRREAYEAIIPQRAKKYRQILEVLDGHEMTATEVAEELYRRGELSNDEPQRVRPRLTELTNTLGLTEVIGKKKDSRTGRTVGVYARRAE